MTILLIILIAVVLWGIFSYNRLVTMINRAKEAWADIDVQLKRRYDLIPNLVNTVKGYAAHETAAFDNVTKARAAAMGAGSLAEKGQAEAITRRRTQVRLCHRRGVSRSEGKPKFSFLAE